MNNGNKLKTIKDNLKKIKKKGINYDKFDEIISKANDAYFICNHFINAYFLYCFEKKIDFPLLDKDFFSMSFKAISKKSVGPKPKGVNEDTLKKLEKFFQDEFINVLKDSSVKTYDIEDFKLNMTNLSFIIDHYVTQMEVMFKNNIILNFFKYVHQYVNNHFLTFEVKIIPRKEFKKLSNNEKEIYLQKRKEETDRNNIIRQEIFKVKNDLCENKIEYLSDKKYHKWIDEHKKIIFPELKDGLLFEDDIKLNYHAYLKHMLLMNVILEKNNKKMFTALPLRTELYDKYVTFNTQAIRDIFGEVHSGLSSKQIWEKYFNINYKPNRKPEFKNSIQVYHSNWFFFNEQICTDGTAVSINLIREDQIEVKNTKSKNKSNASKKSRQLTKNMTKDERSKFQNDKKEKQKKT